MTRNWPLDTHNISTDRGGSKLLKWITMILQRKRPFLKMYLIINNKNNKSGQQGKCRNRYREDR